MKEKKTPGHFQQIKLKQFYYQPFGQEKGGFLNPISTVSVAILLFLDILTKLLNMGTSGINPKGMGDMSPPIFEKGGMAYHYVIIPSNVVKNKQYFELIFTYIQSKSTDFAQKTTDF